MVRAPPTRYTTRIILERDSVNKPQLRLPLDNFVLPSSEADVWRPIHYLGSKLRIVEQLRLAIDLVDPSMGPVCDLFAGSGTVSAALASSRDVVAVDIQEYSRVLCSAILQPAQVTVSGAREFLERALGSQHRRLFEASAPLIDYEEECFRQARNGDVVPLCDLIENASMVAFRGERTVCVVGALGEAHRRARERLKAIEQERGSDTLTLRHFGGLYFSYLQASQLDALLAAAHQYEGELRDFFLAAIISTASEIVNTVGKHFAQPIRPRSGDGQPKFHLIRKILRDRGINVVSLFSVWLDRYRAIPNRGRSHRAIRGDFEDVLKNLDRRIGVVYADPPYTRDHYSRFYHVLETMCLRDDPEVSTTRIRADGVRLSRGMYRADRYQSPFCIVSQAPKAFSRLFASVRDVGAPLVLSYSPYAANSKARPRVMTVDAISSLASKFFGRVEITSAGRISHSKLNATRLNKEQSYDAEIIFSCS